MSNNIYPVAKIIGKDHKETETKFREEELLDHPYMVEYLIKGELIGNRKQGMFQHKAVYLSDSYQWRIVRDDLGLLCLVPTQI